MACRTIKMEAGATLGQNKRLANLREPELLQRGVEARARRHLPQQRNLSQHAEWSEAMPCNNRTRTIGKPKKKLTLQKNKAKTRGVTLPTGIGARSTTIPGTTPKQLQRRLHQGKGHIHQARKKGTDRQRARQKAKLKAERSSRRSGGRPISMGQAVRRKMCAHISTTRCQERCLVCDCKGHRYGQSPRKSAPKPKGGKVSLADAAEEVSE